MKKLFILVLTVLCASCLMADGLSVQQQVDNMMFQARYVQGEIIVKYKDGAIAMNVDARSMSDLGNNTFCMKLRGDMKQALTGLLSNPDVQYAEPNCNGLQS